MPVQKKHRRECCPHRRHANRKIGQDDSSLEFKFPTLPELVRNNDGEVNFILNKTKTVNKDEAGTEDVRDVYFHPWGWCRGT